MSAAMPSPFQVRRDAQIAAQNIAHVAEARGWEQGYAVGKHDMVPHIQRALGVGVLFGVCIGIVLTFLTVGAFA